MKVTRVHIEHAGVVVCLATSASAQRVWDGMHHMLRGRGKRTRNAAIDLLFVVADSRDQHWCRATAPLCRNAQLAVVHGVAYPELGAEQFVHGITTYYTWMVRFFDVVIATEEQPGTVLRALLDYLSRGYICTDSADLIFTLRQVGPCAVHRRAFATDATVDGVRRSIEHDKELQQTIRNASRLIFVARVNGQFAEPYGILDFPVADHVLIIYGIACDRNADQPDIVFFSASAPSEGSTRGIRANPSPYDLATLDTACDRHGEMYRPSRESRVAEIAKSSPELLPRFAGFDQIDIPHLMVVAEFEAGRCLLRTNPALALILARWELCRRSHERLLWWELQDEMKVSAETTRVVGNALAAGSAAMLVAAAFPTHECLPDMLARIPVHLVCMRHLLGVRRIFLDDSAAAMHCRNLLANSPLEHEDVLRLVLNIQLADFISPEFLCELESAAIAPVREHLGALNLAEAAAHLGFNLPRSIASGSPRRFGRLENLLAFMKPGCMVAGDTPLPEQSETFNRLCNVDALLEEWEEMSNHYLGMFVLRDGWDDDNHGFYRVLSPVRATVHFVKVYSDWWLMDALGSDGRSIDPSLLPIIAAAISIRPDEGSTHFARS